MQIQNNLPSMNASRNQSISERKIRKSLEKLSSGFRIVRAGDDAAGLAISEGMRSQINGLNQAMRNVNDGIGLTNVGDGALTEVHAILHRMETLATEAANGTYTQDARENIDMEREELLAEIDRIAENTSYAGIPLFSKKAAGAQVNPPLPERDQPNDIPLQIGASKAETLDVECYYIGSRELLLDKTDFTTVEKANESLGYIEDAIEAVSDVRASFGATYSHLVCTDNNLGVTAENMAAAESRIRDAEIDQEFINYTKTNVVLQVSTAMQAQANALPDMVLKILNN